LNYTRKTKIGSISTVVFYRIIQNEITRFVEIDPADSNKNIMSYTNFKDNKSYGAEISGNLDFTKWWSANVGTDIYFKTIRGTVSSSFVERNANIFNARINNTFKANKNLRFQLFGMYRGQEQSLQFLRNPMYRMDVGASYNVLKGQGILSARASDVFNTMRFSSMEICHTIKKVLLIGRVERCILGLIIVLEVARMLLYKENNVIKTKLKVVEE